MIFRSFYRHAIPKLYKKTRATLSFALGGFSAGWGGAILPAHEYDLKNWPISHEALSDCYASVLKYFPISAVIDDLCSQFPIHADELSPISIDPLSKKFLDDLTAKTKTNEQVFVGQARLALMGNDCEYCGLCLAGCPKKLLYSPEHLLDKFKKDNRLEYLNDRVVTKVIEKNQKVEVRAQSPSGLKHYEYEFDKVLVAAGAIGTARIMLQSREIYNRKLQLLDCEKLAVPMLRMTGSKFDWPKTNTFSSIFIETISSFDERNWVHTQVSAVNEFILSHLNLLGRFELNLMGKSLRPLLSRLLVGFSSFHSNVSSKLILELRNSGGRDTLNISVKDNLLFEGAKADYISGLLELGRQTQTIILPRLSKKWEVGITGHFGGGFPMSYHPMEWNETDVWGRPKGAKRIHLVDASVFPSIPGTTVALLIMANAYRIGKFVGGKD